MLANITYIQERRYKLLISFLNGGKQASSEFWLNWRQAVFSYVAF